MSDKIVDLEIRLAYQEDLLNVLNSQVADQDKEIVKLKQQISILVQKLAVISSADVNDGEDTTTAHDLPPHY